MTGELERQPDSAWSWLGGVAILAAIVCGAALVLLGISGWIS